MLEKIQKQIQRQRLWREGERIVVGVSGGPDSVALLDALWRIGGAKVHACDLNHLLRCAARIDSDVRCGLLHFLFFV